MSCPVKTKLIQDLKDKKAISKTREILDTDKFDSLNAFYTNLARDKYGLDTNGKPFFNVEDKYIKVGNKGAKKYVARAVPNEQLLAVLDDLVENYRNEKISEEKNTRILTKDLVQKDGKDIWIVFDNSTNEVLSEFESVTQADQFIENYNDLQKDQVNFDNITDSNVEDFLFLEDDNITPGYKDNITRRRKNKSLIFKGTRIGYYSDFANVLNNIKNNREELSKAGYELLDFLIPLVENSNATIYRYKGSKESYKKRYGENVMGVYGSFMNQIGINEDYVNKLPTRELLQVIFHEAIHSVTQSAFVSPRTPKEEKFRSIINQAFNDYKRLSKNKNLYGFLKPEEFITEIMTNPEFQNEIKSLQREKINKTLWQEIVDAIRNLIGLPEKYTAIYSYNEVIEAIIGQAKSSNYTGGLTQNGWAFLVDTKKDEENVPFYELDTIQKKQTKLLNDIKDNLEESIRRYDNLIRKVENPSKIKKYSDNLKQVFNEIENYDDAKQWEAISTFVSQLHGTLNSLESKFESEDPSVKDSKETLSLYDNYLRSHALVAPLMKYISEIKADPSELNITPEDLDTLYNRLKEANSTYDALKKQFAVHKRRFLSKYLNDRRYTPEVITKWTNDLNRKHKELGIQENRASWVARQLNTTYKDEVDRDVQTYINKILNDPSFDIMQVTALFNAAINTNSRLVQIFNHMINDVRENIIQRTRESDLELREIYERFIKEKGNKKPSELYKNIYEYDSNGKAWLKGDYKIEFKETYEKLLAELNEEKEKLASEYGYESTQYRTAYKNSKFKKWLDENTTSQKNEFGMNVTRPISKWKTDLSNLSTIEREVLDKFRNITETSNKQTFGIRSLITYMYGGKYYSLPAVTKSDLERVLEGQGKGVVKDKWKDLTNIRVDDIGYDERNIAMDGSPINYVKVYFRGDLEPSQQSLDAFTLYRLEANNGINYQEKHNSEFEFNALLDISRDKDYYRSTGLRIPVLGRHLKRNKRLLVPGTEAKTTKRLEGLIERNIYDILHKKAGKIGPLDANKAVQYINNWTASVGMTLSEVNATANILNGKAQLFIEGIAGNVIKGKSLAKAEGIYFREMANTIRDVSSPIKTSFVNQVNEMFDTFGLVNVSAQQAFIKNTLIRSHGNMQGLQFMQESGEHWLQSVLTMGILDSIKVMDKDNNFINKDGKIVKTEKDAASLLDMLRPDNKGHLKLDPKVVYTTKSVGVEYNKGGKELINNLIKKKIFDTAGNYDPHTQPEAYRHVWGKMLLLYRRYLIPMGIARYRGFAYVDKPVQDLQPHERFYSDALQEYEEGTYTTLVRYIINGIFPAVRKLQFQIMSSNWNTMSEFEKRNIFKAVTEMTITAALLPSLAMLLNAAIGDDDDDNDFLWFLLLETKRLESELQSYRNLGDQYKILRSPIPSARMAENITRVLMRIISPTNWTEQYESGYRKGDYKIQREVERLVPVLNSRSANYKEKYEYIINMTH